MKFITKAIDLSSGDFTLQLDRACRCYIGLVEWHMPCLDKKGDNVIDITCDQIDSDFENPKRLLKRVFPGDENWKKMTHYMPNFIDFKLIDSQDRFLNFKVRLTSGNSSVKFDKSTVAHMVLAIRPINEKDDMWLRI